MAMRPTHTALYELMRGKKSAERRPQTPRQREPEPEPRRSWGSGAGRTIRVPVGYLWLSTAVGIGLLAGVFSMGYMRGHHDATRTLEREWLATRQPALAVPPPEIRDSSPGKTDRAPKPAGGGGQARTPPPAGGPGPILSDPRVAGNNYFILIHTQRDNAVKLADFCRLEGVEAYAVPDRRNRSLYRVIVLPGYARGERSSAPVRALERRIADVTRKWQLQVNSRDDLAYYPERFGG